MLKASLSVFRLLGTDLTGIMCVCGNPVSKDFESYIFILRTVQCFIKQSKAGAGGMEAVFGALATGTIFSSSLRLPPMIPLPGSFARVR